MGRARGVFVSPLQEPPLPIRSYLRFNSHHHHHLLSLPRLCKPPPSTQKFKLHHYAHAYEVVEKRPQRQRIHAKRFVDSTDMGEMGEMGGERSGSKKSEEQSRNREIGSSALPVRRSNNKENDGMASMNSGRKNRTDGYQRNREVGLPEKMVNCMIVEGGVEKRKKINNKSKAMTPEFKLRVGLDMCSKNGDVMRAISLYDSALRDNVMLEQYHYNVLLYLCSSAAIGVVQPGKSGSGINRSNVFPSEEDSSSTDMIHVSEYNHENDVQGKFNNKETAIDSSKKDIDMETRTNSLSNGDCDGIHVKEDIKNYALTRGLEIYEKVCSENILLSEAALTSVARMAMAMNNGDMAFEIAKKIGSLGLTLRLRSYGPALYTYCNAGNIDKAFEVEQHMLENGINPEEPELAALLRASIEGSKNKNVYYLLQKLRSNVRKVFPSTAKLIELWFKSSAASRVGKRKWDEKLVVQAMEKGGGGWHGLGWLGKGKWSVIQNVVDSHGYCQGCGEKLVAIDIDPVETEDFLMSVASLAAKRDRYSNFQKFQKWLESYGPFEAVIDAANVGLFSQRRFSLTKVKSVVNGIRQKSQSKKWPLIIVHNRRIYGGKMDEYSNVKIVEKWKNADALYATPSGSNDDWYWLYAAVKCNALIVTNDEMRDHIFQVLGNDFFPKWKERHQVHFTFSADGPQFKMPPACSVIIQESNKGHWHIPILSEEKSEVERNDNWLCITRATFPGSQKKSPPSKKECPSDKVKAIIYAASRSTLGTSENALASKRYSKMESIIFSLETAEKSSGKVINFEI